MIDLWLQQVEHMEQMNRLKWPNKHKKSAIGKKIVKVKGNDNWKYDNLSNKIKSAIDLRSP